VESSTGKYMTYLEIVNHPTFIAMNKLIHFMEEQLVDMGMTLEEARGWIHAWTSGAGDGSQ
jgi:hypothetical protein